MCWSTCAGPRSCCANYATCWRRADGWPHRCPTAATPIFRWNVLHRRFPRRRPRLFDRTHLHFFTWRGWLDLFQSSGFRIETLRCSGVPIGLALPKWEGTAPVRPIGADVLRIRPPLEDNVRLSIHCDCRAGGRSMTDKPKVVVVMPAYNAAKTLHMTYQDLPRDLVDLVILVDDGSSDETAQIARDMGLELFVHNRNYGYGANQKTCYREALKAGADIVVMVHPDYQYDPTLAARDHPSHPGRARRRRVGSRLMGNNPMKQGMPWWKYVSNRFLTWAENVTFGLKLSEYHTGYRAFRREVLESVNLETNSDKFIFDQEIMAQMVALGMRITEVPVPTRYFAQASSASFIQSSVYGCSILRATGQISDIPLGLGLPSPVR